MLGSALGVGGGRAGGLFGRVGVGGGEAGNEGIGGAEGAERKGSAVRVGGGGQVAGQPQGGRKASVGGVGVVA